MLWRGGGDVCVCECIHVMCLVFVCVCMCSCGCVCVCEIVVAAVVFGGRGYSGDLHCRHIWSETFIGLFLLLCVCFFFHSFCLRKHTVLIVSFHSRGVWNLS